METELTSDVLDRMSRYGIGGAQIRVPKKNYLQDEKGWSITKSNVNKAKENGFQVWIRYERG